MEISTQFIVLVPIIIGLTEVSKKSLSVKTKYVPLVALVLGIGGAFLLGAVDVASGIQGIIVALTSVGLYSSTKNTLK
jgi:hypothetical protein